MQRWQWRTIVLAVIGLSVAGQAVAQWREPRIVNGVATSEYPTAGALLYGGGGPASEFDSYLYCSGTLVGCHTFLTAAHCVYDDPTPEHYLVFLQHAGFFAVSGIEIHPDHPHSGATGDVAVLHLAAPGVTGIAPTPLNDGTEVPFGTTATIVGFGRTGGSAYDYGLKQSGSVTTATCSFVSNDDTSLCWNFNDPLGPPGSNSNTCNGDSGGPLFVAGDCGDVLAGVTSSGINSACLTDDLSIDASVYSHLEFIESAAGADLDNSTCGNVSHVGDSNTVVTSFTGTVSSGAPQAFHAFVAPSGLGELRVALNAIDDGSDFDLYLRQGSSPTTSTYDCAHAGQSQFGYCEIASPAAGAWYVLVDRFSGSGTYQVTVTEVTAALGSFPNDGNPCEDGNVCTGPDTCSALSCMGTSVGDGTPCDDGSICTSADQCQAGLCTGEPAPRTTCKQPPGRSVFLLKDSVRDRKDKVVWKFLRGPATSVADFGDPTGGSPSYTLCVYDESAGTPSLAFDATAPGGGTCKNGRPCWRSTGATANGYKYANKLLNPDGILKMTLRSGSTGGSKIILTAKGHRLGLPDPATPSRFFHQDAAVTVQLVQDDGDCWGASYGTAVENDVDKFKAKCGGRRPACD